MALAEALTSVLYVFLLPPFFAILFTVLITASVGKSLGLRERYVRALIKLFEFCKTRLAAQRSFYEAAANDSDTESSEEERHVTEDESNDFIEREVILRPCLDGASATPCSAPEHFKLASLLDYILAGVEAIVDDEVTKRFTAEELQSWNLLTRTNAGHQYISVRLTIFWVLGFFARYFVLLPVRLAVLFIGVFYTLIGTVIIGKFPDGRIKQWLANCIFLSMFRILARSFSNVVKYHNLENRPKNDGICVANHTSPIDCIVLAQDGCFSFTGCLVSCMYVVGCLSESPFKRRCHFHITRHCFDLMSGVVSLVATYHNRENLPRNGICVANHTTPMDALVLACDNTYDLVGQRQGGFLGLLQRALSRASSHIWFERSEAKDRYAVARRLREHVEDPDKLPILIFPEGTCINNTSVMQFKKGTFEVGGTIYPVAIKYDPRFGDAFWNSSRYGMLSYMFMMMTSWAIVCDVWYLPPMTIRDGESSINFANRVKAEIARQGGLIDLIWDGGLKRSAAKKEWREQYQQEFSRRLRLYSTSSIPKFELRGDRKLSSSSFSRKSSSLLAARPVSTEEPEVSGVNRKAEAFIEDVPLTEIKEKYLDSNSNSKKLINENGIVDSMECSKRQLPDIVKEGIKTYSEQVIVENGTNFCADRFKAE